MSIVISGRDLRYTNMMQSENIDAIKQIIDNAQTIVVVQADNPDGDSLGSALALEHILSDLGKTVELYCAVDVPSYLRYLPGWDRIQKDVPVKFDASIIVDASTMTLFERLETSGQKALLASKPCIVLDHHAVVENQVPFATVLINEPTRSSAGELLYAVASELDWPLSVGAQECIMTAILGDTQGLTNQLASARTYKVMANMIEAGVDRPALEEIRRKFSKMPLEILRYKSTLIARAEFSFDNRLALVIIPQQEINQYSPLYNPAPLIQGDLLQTQDVAVAIVIKQYDDGRVTGAIRCNPGAPIGALVAESLGGGGHAFASGFKVTDGRSATDIKQACIERVASELAKLNEESAHETPQYAYSTN